MYLDSQILPFFYHLRSPFLNSVMIGITQMGGGVMILVGICVFCFLIVRKYYNEALLFALSLCFSALTEMILKNVFHRIRPQFHPLVIETSYSFPSGHATNSLVFYLLLSYLFFRHTKNKNASLIFLLLAVFLILLIGVSRVYLGVHYPSDVIGGYLVGSIVLIITAFIVSILS